MRRFAVPAAVLALVLAACDPAPTASAPLSRGSATPEPVASAASVAPKSAGPTASAKPVVLGDYDASHDAKADLRTALAAAAEDGRPVLVDFGADWCPDCVVLGRLAAKPQVAPALAKFHVVSVDVGKFDKNLGVARQLTVDLDTSGIPALVVLDPRGKVRTVTNDGSFANARTMSAGQVAAFLKKWA